MKSRLGKKNWLALGVATLCFIISTGVCVSVLAQTAGGTQSITVVLDAGHGGIDGGVTGITTGAKESEINLSIVQKLQSCFVQAGVNVVLTRSTSAGLYGLATPGFKRRDMLRRKEIIEESAPAAVLSIHQNSYPSSSRRGGQVFYNAENSYGKRLAERIQCELNALSTVKPYQPLEGDYYMLNCTTYPSVICECGFLTSPDDEKLLLDEEYQRQLALSIFRGTISFLSLSSSLQ